MRRCKRGLYARYLLEGGNINRLLMRLHAENVAVLDVCAGEKSAAVSIPFADRKKFFAICGEMCYNIIEEPKKRAEDFAKSPKKRAASGGKSEPRLKKLGDGGFLKPFVFLRARLGLCLGAAIFAAAACFADGIVLGTSLAGVDPALKSAVADVLEECGAVRFAKFSSLDADEIGREIVKKVPLVRFASVEKRGSFLAVQTLSGEDETSFGEDVSPIDGTVERMVVYRGTALFKEGDAVKRGDRLVDGRFAAGGAFIETVPMFYAEISGEYKTAVTLKKDDPVYVAAAIAVAREKCPFSRIIGEFAETEEAEGGYIATVTLRVIAAVGGAPQG